MRKYTHSLPHTHTHSHRKDRALFLSVPPRCLIWQPSELERRNHHSFIKGSRKREMSRMVPWHKGADDLLLPSKATYWLLRFNSEIFECRKQNSLALFIYLSFFFKYFLIVWFAEIFENVKGFFSPFFDFLKKCLFLFFDLFLFSFVKIVYSNRFSFSFYF